MISTSTEYSKSAKKSVNDMGEKKVMKSEKQLKKLEKYVMDNREIIIEAINKDYGNRSRHETLNSKVLTVADDISTTSKHLKK